MKDAVISDLDFDFENADTKELKELLNIALIKIGIIEEELKKLNNSITQSKLVDRKQGRPRAKMFYDGKEISDKDLIYMVKNMDMGIAEICKHFYYKDVENNRIYDKDKCYRFIKNRLNRFKET